MRTPRWRRFGGVCALLLAALAVGSGCDAGDELPRVDAGPGADRGETDGAIPDPDVALPDPDAGPSDGALDRAIDGPLLDGSPVDADPVDGADAGPADLGSIDGPPPDTLPDSGPPPGCLPWADVPDDQLVARLHAELHETYRPIEAELDLGGNPNRYTTARHFMFAEVEWFDDPERGGGYECVYTGRFVASAPDEEPDNDVMNCEHTWPRARMSPRDTLRYSHEQSDIHHLLPTISGANSLRGSERFGDVENGRNLDYLPAVYGTDARGEIVFQPRRERQGDVARVIFYFSVRWGKPIRDDEEAALRGWMTDDPVDDRERARNDAVEAIQGNRNPFVDCPGLVARIADFAAFETLDTEENLPAP